MRLVPASGWICTMDIGTEHATLNYVMSPSADTEFEAIKARIQYVVQMKSGNDESAKLGFKVEQLVPHSGLVVIINTAPWCQEVSLPKALLAAALTSGGETSIRFQSHLNIHLNNQ